jgi:receptor expression-enhancing protein 5/6
MDHVKPYLDRLDAELSKIPLARQFEARTGVKKSYAALGAAAALSSLFLLHWAGGLLATLVGFAYPAYASMRAIETASKEDDTKWLTYWVVFAAISVLDHFSSAVLRWFPVYHLAKAALFLWLYLPSTMGANLLYDRALKPLVAQLEASCCGASRAGPGPAVHRDQQPGAALPLAKDKMAHAADRAHAELKKDM